MQKYAAVIFDLDGTLIDSEKHYIHYWQQASINLGHPLTYEQCLELRSLESGLGQKAFQEWFGDSSLWAKTREERRRLMQNCVMEPKDGAKELAIYLQSKGIPYCVCTASPAEVGVRSLAQAGLGEYFPKVISAKQAKRGKPYPDPYLMCCELLGVNPKDCLAVEDSPNGVKSASSAGLNVVFAVDRTEIEEDLKPKVIQVIHSLKELIEE